MDSTEYMEEEDKKDVKQETGINEYFEEKTFKNNEYFEEDVKTEHKEQIIRSSPENNLCNICKKQYKTKINLSTHMQSVHKGVKYPCNQCEYKATEQGSLKRHIESVHEKVKYPCNQCEYKATQQSHLKRHIKSVHEKNI